MTKSDKTGSQTRLCFNWKLPCSSPPALKYVAKEKGSWRGDQSRLTQKKPDNLEYLTITVGAKQIRSCEPQPVKRHDWIAPENLTQTFNGIGSQGAVRKITNPATTVDIERKELNSSPFYYKTCLGCCSRACSKNANELLAKEFCNILGPETCNECFKSQKKTLEEAELKHCHPDIRVSPYRLCVEQNTNKTVKMAISSSPTINRECETLYRRVKLARPFLPRNNISGLKTRPNSINENVKTICFDERSSYPPSPGVTLPSSGSPCPSTPDCQAGPMQPKFTRNNARGSSVTRTVKSGKEDTRREKEDSHQQEVINEDANIPIGVKSVTVRPLGTKPRPYESTSAKYKHGLLKSAKIERTGKLSELPYWKFLIPEPPQMALELMNVSIYTPKLIPGIKIFDESLFEI